MRDLVGKTYGQERQSVPISVSDIRRWALALYYPESPPRLFWDEDYAAGSSHGGIVAPEEFNPFAWFTSDGPVLPPSYDGVVQTGSIEEAFGVGSPATRFVLNGGTEVRYGVRMRPNDVITAGKSTLVEYKERTSRLGLMLVTVNESMWTNQDGDMVKVVRNTGIRY